MGYIFFVVIFAALGCCFVFCISSPFSITSHRDVSLLPISCIQQSSLLLNDKIQLSKRTQLTKVCITYSLNSLIFQVKNTFSLTIFNNSLSLQFCWTIERFKSETLVLKIDWMRIYEFMYFVCMNLFQIFSFKLIEFLIDIFSIFFSF